MTDQFQEIRPDTLFSMRTLSVKEQQEQETNIENLILKLESNQNLEPNSLTPHVKDHLNPIAGNIDQPEQENMIFEETSSFDLYKTNKSNFDELAHSKTVQQKRLFFRRMEQEEFEWESKNVKRKDYDGIFDQDKRTYSPLTMAVTENTMTESNEVWMNLHCELMVSQELESAHLATKKHQKVYRGNLKKWTSLDHNLGEETIEKFQKDLKSYSEPQFYEDRFQTMKRREKALEGLEEEQSEFVELPYRTRYVDGGQRV